MPPLTDILSPMAVTAIGSMPHATVAAALRPVVACASKLPAWPQLVRRSRRDRMLAQELATVPGTQVDEAGAVTLPHGFERAPAEHSKASVPAALTDLVHAVPMETRALKGQVTGPVTLALNTRLANGCLAADDPAVCDALAYHVASAAAQQEVALSTSGRHTLMFIDEPDLGRGLRDPRLGPDRCTGLLRQVMDAVSGAVGLHDCGLPNLDFLTGLPLQVMSFDAYRYGDVPTAQQAEAFLAGGGWIAWGIVPSEADLLHVEDAVSLTRRLQALWVGLERGGVSGQLLRQQALITPSCGLGWLSVAEAERALDLAQRVADGLCAEGRTATPMAGLP